MADMILYVKEEDIDKVLSTCELQEIVKIDCFEFNFPHFDTDHGKKYAPGTLKKEQAVSHIKEFFERYSVEQEAMIRDYQGVGVTLVTSFLGFFDERDNLVAVAGCGDFDFKDGMFAYEYSDKLLEYKG